MINYVDKETALVSDPLFSQEAVEQYLGKEDVKIDKQEGLETMQSDLRKNQEINQIRTQNRRKIGHVWCLS